jgi:hypothetical protein
VRVAQRSDIRSREHALTLSGCSQLVPETVGVRPSRVIPIRKSQTDKCLQCQVRVRVFFPILHGHSKAASRQTGGLSLLKLADGLSLARAEHRVQSPGQLHGGERLMSVLWLGDASAERGSEGLVTFGKGYEDLLVWQDGSS